MCSNREAQTHGHSGRIVLHRCINEALQPCKLDNAVELSVHVFFGHAQDGGVEVDVFPARQLWVETRTQLQKRSHVAIDRNFAFVRAVDTREAFQHGALTRTVRSDDANGGAMINSEGNIIERPKLLVSSAPTAQNSSLQIAITFVIQTKIF